MKHTVIRNLLSTALVILLLLTGCSMQSNRKPTETTPAPTSASVVSESTQTPASKPTSKPSPKPTLNPTLTSVPSLTEVPTPEPDPWEGYRRYEYVLTQEVFARTLDDVAIRIPVGQVIRVYEKYDERTSLECAESPVYEANRFFLGTSEEILFDISQNRYGTICVSGVPAFQLFKTLSSALSDPKPETELEPWVQMKNISEYGRLFMNVDWDKDGIIDEVSVTRFDYETLCVSFRSGLDGSVAIQAIPAGYSFDSKWESETEYRERLGIEDLDFCEDENAIPVWICSYQIGVETIMLYQDSQGNNRILLGHDLSTLLVGDCIPLSLLISYDPHDIFACEEKAGAYDYEDQRFYKADFSQVLGKTWTTKKEITLLDDFSYEFVSDTVQYESGHRAYTYSLRSVSAEIGTSNSFMPETLSRGSIVIPVKTIMNSSGSGYLYVTLIDGRSARIPFEYDYANDQVLMDGQPQESVFFCYYIDWFCAG